MEGGETERMKGLTIILVKCTHISSKHCTNEGSATASRQTGCMRNRVQELNDFTIISFRIKTELLKLTFSNMHYILKVPEPLLGEGWRINEKLVGILFLDEHFILVFNSFWC